MIGCADPGWHSYLFNGTEVWFGQLERQKTKPMEKRKRKKKEQSSFQVASLVFSSFHSLNCPNVWSYPASTTGITREERLMALPSPTFGPFSGPEVTANHTVTESIMT